MAIQQCYDIYNTQGTQFGSCGYSNEEFMACSDQNVLCGQLQCLSGSFQNTISGVTPLTGRIRVNGETVYCRSFAPSTPTTDLMHPGLVQDGTKCGDEMVS